MTERRRTETASRGFPERAQSCHERLQRELKASPLGSHAEGEISVSEEKPEGAGGMQQRNAIDFGLEVFCACKLETCRRPSHRNAQFVAPACPHTAPKSSGTCPAEL